MAAVQPWPLVRRTVRPTPLSCQSYSQALVSASSSSTETGFDFPEAGLVSGAESRILTRAVRSCRPTPDGGTACARRAAFPLSPRSTLAVAAPTRTTAVKATKPAEKPRATRERLATGVLPAARRGQILAGR